MVVKNIKDNDKELELRITNGDLEKLKKVMSKYKFKDYQSFLRFAISILLLTEDNYLWIERQGEREKIGPADDYIKKSQED